MLHGLALALCLATPLPLQTVDTRDTRLLAQPAASGTHVAFVYADDLWASRLDGSEVRRLTTHAGIESNPRFSPDGQTLAFSAQYDGNTDVYVVGVEGGEPLRLTWHPGPDLAQGFSPDGAEVLFTSARSAHTRRFQQLFAIPAEGGHPRRLPLPSAFKAAWSPDGNHIAYRPLADVFGQWKNYRGGTAARIWIYDVRDHSIEMIPQPEGRCNDTDPAWIGGRVYFRSDREGEFNLFSYERGSGQVTRLTRHGDFPVLALSAGAGRIVYEQAGWLHLFEPVTGSHQRLAIGVSADLIETRPRWVEGSDQIRDASISPSGARAVFEARGEIVTVPAEKGDPRNLTRSPGACERSPAWSPDGDRIAWLSDESGEYRLCLAAQDGKGEVRTFALEGAGFYEDLAWSPDGERISYTDNSWSLFWIDLESGASRKISSEPIYGPFKTLRHSWSPDSRWIAYTRSAPTYFRQVHVYSIEEDRSYPITDGLSDVSEPVFDASGDYLYFLASTDAGPVLQWFAQSNADVRGTSAPYLAVLRKGEPSPLARESDEEEPAEEPAEENGEEEELAEAEEEASEVEEDLVTIDFEGLEQRILALPVAAGAYSSLRAGTEGKVYYLKAEGGARPFGGADRPTGLYRFDLEEREEKELAPGIDAYRLSHGGEKALLYSGGSWSIAAAGDSIDPGAGRLDTDAIRIRIDPRAEWRQMFHEAWRINRDFFYAPNMHGADWPAMRVKYGDFLPHLAVRGDLNRVIRWMCSELCVGHHSVGGGDTLARPEPVGGGLLGADYEVVGGRYRLAKVLGGLNWNPELRSPLTEPGVDARAGELLLAVEGVELRAPENIYGRFEGAVGRSVEITLGPAADGTDSRTVSVVPVASEAALRNRDWVEGNLRRVTEATDGRVAYVHVPNTAGLGHTYFKRYFFPQADRQAIIIDERHNAGGQVADYYIDILRRPLISHWAMRYGADLKTPLSSIQGPKVMLIDESAGSGGDMLPWMFRKLELGVLVGRPTWGGLVGVLGFPALMDGGYVSAPNLAIWTEDGFVVENVGVPPDVEVEQLPAEVIAGRDPQLERAIEIALEMLEANPPKVHQRPPYPVRARR